MTERSFNSSESSIILLNSWTLGDERMMLEPRGSSTHYVPFDLLNTTETTGNTSSIYSDEDIWLDTVVTPLYSTIFALSVIGNSLVIITLSRNKRMRNVTNVYLLNLAISDLLVGVFCMPFTLVGNRLRNFVFGSFMCKLIPFCQAVSVSVGVWTLVAISLERFFAICRPLKSRTWQTQYHAWKMIGVVWTVSLIWTSPTFFVSTLQNIRDGRQKCREEWPGEAFEKAYTIFLDCTLLFIPLLIMTVAYSLIAIKLWRGLKREIRQSSTCQQRLERVGSSGARLHPYSNIDRENATSAVTVVSGNGTVSKQSTPSTCLQVPTGSQSAMQAAAVTSKGRKLVKLWLTKRSVCPPRSGTSKFWTGRKNMKFSGQNMLMSSRLQTGIKKPEETAGANKNSGLKDVQSDDHSDDTVYSFDTHKALRSNFMGKSIVHKKKVIKMLFVIVLEFFICWAPLYLINTLSLYDPNLVYTYIGRHGISLIQLLAYISSCCNPITYCFMNRRFRKSFVSVFDCFRCWLLKCRDEDISAGATRIATQPGNSEPSGNESTIYLGRTSVVARSEVVRLLEEEDRV